MTSDSPDMPRLGGRHRLLLRVERFSRNHYRSVFLLGLLALLGGIWLGSKLELESNVLALIPEGNRQVDTYKQALQDFGSIDYLLVDPGVFPSGDRSSLPNEEYLGRARRLITFRRITPPIDRAKIVKRQAG